MNDYSMYVPFVNRIDLLRRAVDSAYDLHAGLNVIDNSKPGVYSLDFPHIHVMRPPVPLFFSQTMNWMLADCRRQGANICLWMHSDAEAAPQSCLQLLYTARQYEQEGRKWGVLFTNYDALAAMNVRAFEWIGGWDVNFQWYNSDVDAYRRLKLAGFECIDTNLPVYHTPSQTLNSDPEIRAQVEAMIPLRNLYYRLKWGADPGYEKFTTPFGKGPQVPSALLG